ncbi:hypothetical protein LR48_Vigan2505s000100 [Vigna angularis]|uniref:Uncharacterized protein n=2 Tax=Phaseolus angularis TaxID=3914 RepID=A0A8T0JPJ2_PHAAN|nr:uncharacterized protein HKW66_Vig0169470 [Vigna angularis]KOM24763.1 hypothetical protein LR48_Vigan2505s000100 [Vigna angularis]BAT98139.1 hypothetical protein VIGAN_09176600 [Vigna angularis var. angularis]
MENPIPIRPWSRLASVTRPPPAPKTLPETQHAELSLKAVNTSSHDGNESTTKSRRPTPDVHCPTIQSEKLKLTTPISFPPSKLKGQAQLEKKPTGNGYGSVSWKKEYGETQKQGIDESKGAHIQNKPFNKMGNSSGEEVNGKMKNKSGKLTIPCSSPLRVLYANSNVQCVNNSIVLNTSLTHHDPGVHLFIPKKPFS